MASLKADKPAGTQLAAAPVKKEQPKPSNTAAAPKAPASKPATVPLKAELKPREPKKKATGSKPAAK